MNAEELLRETLAERAAEMPLARTGVDVIRRRARSQRRRTTGVSALAAAAAVVMTVGAVQLLDRPGTSRDLPPADTSPTTTAMAEDGSALRAIPEGAKPGVGWVDGNVVRLSDGGGIDLPAGPRDVIGVAAYHGGYLFTTGSAGGVVATLQEVGNDGSQRRTTCGGFRLVTSPDGVVTSWVQLDECSMDWVGAQFKLGIASGMSEDESSLALADGYHYEPVGIVGDSGVWNSFDAQTSAPKGVWWTSTMLGPPERIKGLTSGVDLNGDRQVLGLGGPEADLMIVDGRSKKVILDLPGWIPIRFNPEGDQALAVRSAIDGTLNVALFDVASGEQVRDVALPQGIGGIDDARWEQDGSILMVAQSGQASTLLRVDPQGRFTRATAVKSSRRLSFVAGYGH